MAKRSDVLRTRTYVSFAHMIGQNRPILSSDLFPCPDYGHLHGSQV